VSHLPPSAASSAGQVSKLGGAGAANGGSDEIKPPRWHKGS